MLDKVKINKLDTKTNSLNSKKSLKRKKQTIKFDVKISKEGYEKFFPMKV